MRYLRADAAGGTYFFTVNLADRRADTLVRHIDGFREVLHEVLGFLRQPNLRVLIETAKTNGLEPYAYLRRVFTELPQADSVEAIEALLPDAGK